LNERLPFLRKKASELPLSPGVYLMRDEKGVIIYIGKSRALRNRVSSYFIGTQHSAKTAKMVDRVRDFETVLCDTEIEALTLENILIKKHAPKYNIKLKDAKSYPYIKVTRDAYPQLLVTRERKPDGAHYYGPYSGTSTAYDALDTVKRIFSLPTCKRVFPRDIGKERPCIYKEMNRCLGLCTGEVSEKEFRRRVDAAMTVLRGEIRTAVKEVEAAMMQAAEEERFEEAAALRDSITALKKLREKQKVVSDADTDTDAVAFCSDASLCAVAILSIRGGQMTNKTEFLFSGDEIVDEDGIAAFLSDHYGDGASLPREILLSEPLSSEENELLSTHFSALLGKKVTLRTPQRGKAKSLCDMACANAKEKIAAYRHAAEKEDKNLLLLTEMLSLEVVPDRIEAYDISNIGDEFITASMVVYQNGSLQKGDYRTFRVRVGEARDDYASMREALSRRLSHIGDGESSLGVRPDLILLDGGRGQVSAVREVMEEMGISIALFGMVKDDFHKTRALTDGENEIGIAREPGVYALIYRLQEEAHRVAYSRSQNAKRKTLKHSSLEKIAGIGPVKAKALLSAFGTLKRLSVAEQSELLSVRGITPADAEAVYHYFESKRKETEL